MDKSAPPAQLHAPPAQRGLFMFGKSFPTPGIHTLVESTRRGRRSSRAEGGGAEAGGGADGGDVGDQALLDRWPGAVSSPPGAGVVWSNPVATTTLSVEARWRMGDERVARSVAFDCSSSAGGPLPVDGVDLFELAARVAPTVGYYLPANTADDDLAALAAFPNLAAMGADVASLANTTLLAARAPTLTAATPSA